MRAAYLKPPSAAPLFVALALVTVCLGSNALPSVAGPDYPWTCRDADAVMAAARKYSYKTPVLQWDAKKIRQAGNEYFQCGKEAADDEDRFKSDRGMTFAFAVLAQQYSVYAQLAKYLTHEPISDRRRFFDSMRLRAVREYGLAQEMADLAIKYAGRNGIDTSDFEAWAQHNISDQRAEIRAMSFSKLPEVASPKRPISRAVARPPASIVRARPSSLPCLQPNIAATSVHPVEPDTPPMAEQQGIQGTVQVVVSLNADSKVVGTRIQASPSVILNNAALSAARQSTFQTEIRDCKPIAAEYIFSVDFTNP